MNKSPLVEALNDAASARHEASTHMKRLEERGLRVGLALEVVRGRKIPKGTTGTLEGWGENDFGRYVRFTLNGHTVFTALHNVAFPELEAERQAAYTAANNADDAYREISKVIVTQSGLDLSKPLAKGELHQHSYSDSYEADYACNPDCPDDVLRAAVAILDPPQSSWGRLRWSTGSSIQSRDGGTVRIYSGTGICD